MADSAKEIFQPVDDAILAEVRQMIELADQGALATLEPETGQPLVSRVGIASDFSAQIVFPASGLTDHFKALQADPRCSLLIGVPGKGDPLAHPRVSLIGQARALEPESEAAATAHGLYVHTHPKSKIYLDLPDFRLFALDVERVHFNGGFGRAARFDGAMLNPN